MNYPYTIRCKKVSWKAWVEGETKMRSDRKMRTYSLDNVLVTYESAKMITIHSKVYGNVRKQARTVDIECPGLNPNEAPLDVDDLLSGLA